MKKARNVINKWGLSMFVALMLLCLAFGASAEGTAATEAELDDYAGISCNLYKNNQMEGLFSAGGWTRIKTGSACAFLRTYSQRKAM